MYPGDAGGNCDHGGLGRHDRSFLPHPAQGYKFLSPGEWLVDVLPGVFRTKPLAETGFSPEWYPLWDAKKQKNKKNLTDRGTNQDFGGQSHCLDIVCIVCLRSYCMSSSTFPNTKVLKASLHYASSSFLDQTLLFGI